MNRQKAQSESVGVILLLAVVVVTVTTGGYFALDSLGGSTGPNTDIRVETAGQDLVVKHVGGEKLSADKLQLRVGGDTVPATKLNPDIDGTTFAPGESWRQDMESLDTDVTQGTDVTVTVAHTGTNALVTQTDVFISGVEGRGTYSQPYKIADSEDLQYLSQDLSANYKITDDITYEGDGFVPVATDEEFTGQLDGDGHTISELTIDGDDDHAAMFGTVDGTVRDIQFENAEVSGSDTTETAIVAGQYYGGSNTDLEIEIRASEITTDGRYTGGFAAISVGMVRGIAVTDSTIRSEYGDSRSASLDQPARELSDSGAETARPFRRLTTGGESGIARTGGVIGAILEGDIRDVAVTDSTITGPSDSTGAVVGTKTDDSEITQYELSGTEVQRESDEFGPTANAGPSDSTGAIVGTKTDDSEITQYGLSGTEVQRESDEFGPTANAGPSDDNDDDRPSDDSDENEDTDTPAPYGTEMTDEELEDTLGDTTEVRSGELEPSEDGSNTEEREPPSHTPAEGIKINKRAVDLANPISPDSDGYTNLIIIPFTLKNKRGKYRGVTPEAIHTAVFGDVNDGVTSSVGSLRQYYKSISGGDAKLRGTVTPWVTINTNSIYENSIDTIPADVTIKKAIQNGYIDMEKYHNEDTALVLLSDQKPKEESWLLGWYPTITATQQRVVTVNYENGPDRTTRMLGPALLSAGTDIPGTNRQAPVQVGALAHEVAHAMYLWKDTYKSGTPDRNPVMGEEFSLMGTGSLSFAVTNSGQDKKRATAPAHPAAWRKVQRGWGDAPDVDIDTDPGILPRVGFGEADFYESRGPKKTSTLTHSYRNPAGTDIGADTVYDPRTKPSWSEYLLSFITDDPTHYNKEFRNNGGISHVITWESSVRKPGEPVTIDNVKYEATKIGRSGTQKLGDVALLNSPNTQSFKDSGTAVYAIDPLSSSETFSHRIAWDPRDGDRIEMALYGQNRVDDTTYTNTLLKRAETGEINYESIHKPPLSTSKGRKVVLETASERRDRSFYQTSTYTLDRLPNRLELLTAKRSVKMQDDWSGVSSDSRVTVSVQLPKGFEHITNKNNNDIGSTFNVKIEQTPWDTTEDIIKPDDVKVVGSGRRARISFAVPEGTFTTVSQGGDTKLRGFVEYRITHTTKMYKGESYEVRHTTEPVTGKISPLSDENAQTTFSDIQDSIKRIDDEFGVCISTTNYCGEFVPPSEFEFPDITDPVATIHIQGPGGSERNVFEATYHRESKLLSSRDGSGSADDPYKIDSWLDLQLVRYDLDSHYELTADLSIENYPWSDKSKSTPAFEPIGGCEEPFTGTLEGNGHVIADLYINRPRNNCIGLFGRSDGTITNVGVQNAFISGKKSVGGLAGVNTGEIRGSYVEGMITGIDSGSESIGGLVGVNKQVISESYALANVLGSKYAGGLVGKNTEATHMDGTNKRYSTISQSYAIGYVAGNEYLGGLVGQNRGHIETTYAMGTVTGIHQAETYFGGLWTRPSATYVGGLVGEQACSENQCATAPKPSTTRSYAVVKVPKDSELTGSAIGKRHGKSAFGDVYVAKEYHRRSSTSHGTHVEGGIQKPASKMRGNKALKNMDKLRCSDCPNWKTTEGGYPQPEEVGRDRDMGTTESVDGTVIYQISNWFDLDYVRHDLTGQYELTNDLTNRTRGYRAVASSGAHATDGFRPIGNPPNTQKRFFQGLQNSIPASSPASPFTGQFDGNGHTISGLRIDRPTTDDVGLFSAIADGGSVGRVTLIDIAVRGDENVGGIAGYVREGTISQSSVRGKGQSDMSPITGTKVVGGVVGSNDVRGIIEQSGSAYLTIRGTKDTEKVGAIAGYNHGTRTCNREELDDWVRICTLESPVDPSGIIQYTTSILNDIQTDDVGYNADPHRPVGVNNGYYDNSITSEPATPPRRNALETTEEQPASTGETDSNSVSIYMPAESPLAGSPGVTGLTPEQMIGRDAPDHMSGLDFEHVWQAQRGEHPELQPQPELEITSVPSDTDIKPGESIELTVGVQTENANTPSQPTYLTAFADSGEIDQPRQSVAGNDELTFTYTAADEPGIKHTTITFSTPSERREMTVHVYPTVEIASVTAAPSTIDPGTQTDVRATLQTEFGNTPEQPVDLTASVRNTDGESSDRRGRIDPTSTSSSGQETVGFTYTAPKRGTTDTVKITSNAPTSTDSGETEIGVRLPELEIENIDVDPSPVDAEKSVEVTVTVKNEFGETPMQAKRLTAHGPNAGSDITPIGRYKTVRMTPAETEKLTGVDTSNPDPGTIGELNDAIDDDPYIVSISPISGSNKWRVVKTYEQEYLSNRRIGALTGVDTSNPDPETIDDLNDAIRDDPEFIEISPDPTGNGWFVKTSVNYTTELMSPSEVEELTGVDTSNPDSGTIGELNDAIRDDPDIISIEPNPNGHGWFVKKNMKNMLDGAETIIFRYTAPKWDDVREQYGAVDDETETWNDWIEYRIDGTKKTSNPINVARGEQNIFEEDVLDSWQNSDCERDTHDECSVGQTNEDIVMLTEHEFPILMSSPTLPAVYKYDTDIDHTGRLRLHWAYDNNEKHGFPISILINVNRGGSQEIGFDKLVEAGERYAFYSGEDKYGSTWREGIAGLTSNKQSWKRLLPKNRNQFVPDNKDESAGPLKFTDAPAAGSVEVDVSEGDRLEVYIIRGSIGDHGIRSTLRLSKDPLDPEDAEMDVENPGGPANPIKCIMPPRPEGC